MSTSEPEYGTTHRLITVTFGVALSAQPVPFPPSPHGWRLRAATVVSWQTPKGYQLLYTWFWSRVGRERVVAALAGGSDEPAG